MHLVYVILALIHTFLTLSMHALEGYSSYCVSVCLSVKSHLTSGASICPENAVTDSAGNVSQRFSLELLRCRVTALPAL